MIDADLRKKNLDELRPLQASLLKAFQSYTDDPTLQRDLQAWPSEPKTSPQEGHDPVTS